MLIEGRIYCRVERDPVSVVHGNTIDLVNQQHYLLLSGGETIFADSVGPHNGNRGHSDRQYWLTGADITTTTTTEPPPITPPEDPIYVGCDDTKLCFGIPINCISTQNCNLLATIYYNGGDFEFELLSMRKKNFLHSEMFC